MTALLRGLRLIPKPRSPVSGLAVLASPGEAGKPGKPGKQMPRDLGLSWGMALIPSWCSTQFFVRVWESPLKVI